VCVLTVLAGLALAQAAPPAGGNNSVDQLNTVLTRMDQTAEKFRTTQAKGTLYFRRAKGGIEMAAQITEPNKKYVLFDDSKVRMYEPAPLDRETVYNTGKSKADVESFMALGFGGGGHALLKSFDVRYLGTEDAQGVKADKLELVPKSQRTRNTFSQIVLWIDPARGVSVQQKLLSPEGDYRLAKYSNIQLNPKIPDDVFKLKTTSKTTVVSPQG
jgi:outer membrane lipoprotein-sorting protein